MLHKEIENVVLWHEGNIGKNLFISSNENIYYSMLHAKQEYQYHMTVQLSDLLKHNIFITLA